ncbi:MAG: hypothetical protein BGP06_02595 [Rhizobiales bacterium 65-9]|nr:DUF126 domain-containing protein [Hyphomicrobiales bacterium]OJY34356.1 MAG: hypothetical protein BGP06_02595 [Rhizobiales bacterium 65-9]
MALKAEALIPGEARGRVCVLRAPISFWGGVDPRTGDVIDARHPDRGLNIAGVILGLPGTIGSSSASSVLLELVHAGRAPAALLVVEPDAVLLLGLIVAREMGWPRPPAIRCDAAALAGLHGRRIAIGRDGTITPLAEP